SRCPPIAFHSVVVKYLQRKNINESRNYETNNLSLWCCRLPIFGYFYLFSLMLKVPRIIVGVLSLLFSINSKSWFRVCFARPKQKIASRPNFVSSFRKFVLCKCDAFYNVRRTQNCVYFW